MGSPAPEIVNTGIVPESVSRKCPLLSAVTWLPLASVFVDGCADVGATCPAGGIKTDPAGVVNETEVPPLTEMVSPEPSVAVAVNEVTLVPVHPPE